MKKWILSATCAAFAWPTIASAQISTIWVNNAGFTAPKIQNFDLSGNLLQTINAPHGNNGRGIVQVGDIVYYTSASTNGVYGYNFKTNTDLGTLFSVPGASGLATMAYDGTSFYLGDYSGTSNVFKYSSSGTPLGTISLANCTGYCDGLEYANGTLISNREDGGSVYDVYSLTGTLLQSAFITSSTSSTGIAYDGTYFYTDNVYGSSFNKYDSTGHLLGTTSFQGGTLGEDLSVNYSARVDTGGPVGGVPEPAAWAMMIFGFGAVGSAMRRRKQVTRVSYAV